MDIPNTFKNRAGAIQLSDLDDNFGVVKVSVNTLDQQVALLQAGQASLTTQIANFSAIPIGCIVMWSGTISTIPLGWRLCDGTNNTPDLRNKFVIGAQLDASSKAQTTVTGVNTQTGGTKDAQVVAHSHTATSTASSTASSSATVSSDTDSWSNTIRAQDGATLIPISGEVTQGYDWGYIYNGSNGYWSQSTQVTMSHSHTHSHTVAITTTVSTGVTTAVASEGVSGTNANLPPYYALAYIMKT